MSWILAYTSSSTLAISTLLLPEVVMYILVFNVNLYNVQYNVKVKSSGHSFDVLDNSLYKFLHLSNIYALHGIQLSLISCMYTINKKKKLLTSFWCKARDHQGTYLDDLLCKAKSSKVTEPVLWLTNLHS